MSLTVVYSESCTITASEGTLTSGLHLSSSAEPRECWLRDVHQTTCRSLAGSHKVQCWGHCSSYCLSMTSRTRSSRRLACLPMTVLFIDQSTTTVIAQPCNKTSILWQSGKPSGAWRTILRSVVFWVYLEPDLPSDTHTSWKDTSSRLKTQRNI